MGQKCHSLADSVCHRLPAIQLYSAIYIYIFLVLTLLNRYNIQA